MNGEISSTRSKFVKSPLIYLVEDDDDLREELLVGLTEQGFVVHGFDGAGPFYKAYAAKPADIVILDVGLEGEDGLSIATHLRTSQSVGIIMATGRGSVDDRIDGLSTGADAYLVKPVDIRELAATIQALSSRLNARGVIASTAVPAWSLLEGGWILSDGLGNRLRLTTAEQRLLSGLLRERGQIVARRALVEALEEDVFEYDYAHLDTIISRLRRRARKAKMELPLHAIRGMGFSFSD